MGTWCSAGDEEALAERILDLLNCTGCRALFSLQAMEYAQDYAWAKVVERMQVVYNDVLHDSAYYSVTPCAASAAGTSRPGV